MTHQKGRKGLTVILIALQILQPLFNAAQAAGVAPTTAGVTQEQAANGVPIVNIAAPGAAGISHNRYSQFDVDRAGLILNNSGQPVNTQLGGFIPGNGNLGGGAARLILNEVTSAHPSQLNGYMEVAGQKADVVVANPYGITCRGCGFINTSRATLSTGKAVLANDGSLGGFTVENGVLRIEGEGLNATNTESLALYARVLELNAALYANELQVATGANSISATTGVATPLNTTTAAPAYAIDSSALGGMYANTIRLVGTEAGVGMRLAGPVAALTGKLEISANGDVHLARASAQQEVLVSAKDQLVLSNQTSAGGHVNMQASDLVLESAALLTGTDMTLSAGRMSTANGSAIAARGDLQLQAGTLNNAGNLASTGSMRLETNRLANSGTMAAQSSLSLRTDLLDTYSGSTLGAHAAITIHAGDINNAGLLTAGSSLQLDASRQLNNSGRIDAQSTVNLSAGAWINSGQLTLIDGPMNLGVREMFDNRGGSVRHGGDQLTLQAGALDNRGGTLITHGSLQLTLNADLLNETGVIQSDQTLHINSHGIDNSAGQLTGSGAIQLALRDGALINSGGEIKTNAGISITGAQTEINNSNGKVMAKGPIAIDLQSGSINNSQGGVMQSESALQLTTHGSQATINNSNGSLLGAGEVSLTLNDGILINNQGKVQSDTGLSVISAGTQAGIENVGGALLSKGGIYLDVRDGFLNNSTGLIQGEQATQHQLQSQIFDNRNGSLELGSGVLGLMVQALDNRDGYIHHAGTQLTLNTGTLDNRGGEIASNGAATLTVSEPAALLNNNGLLQGNASLLINSHGLDNSHGQVLGDGQVRLQMNHAALINSSGVIETLGAINVEQVAGIDNSSGKLLGDGDISLALGNSQLTNTGGVIETTNNLLVTNAGGLNNQSGVLRSGKDLTLNLPAFDWVLSGGKYSAVGELAIHTTGDIFFSGEEFSTPGGLWLDAADATIQLDSRVISGADTTLTGSTITLGDDGFLATQGALFLEANNLSNLGVIYGRDALTLHIENVLNNGSAGSVRDAAMLSEGDISISTKAGGRLIALNNYASLIETSSGDISINADVINNINIGWAVKAPYQTTEYRYSDSADAWNAYNRGCADEDVVTYRWVLQTTHNDIESYGKTGQIISGGNITIDAGTINNDHSTISARDTLTINADEINNTATTLRDIIESWQKGRYWYCYYKHGTKRCKESSTNTTYSRYEGPDVEIIPSVIEGGTVVINASAIRNGEQIKEGNTAYIPAGTFLEMPETAPQDILASGGSGATGINATGPVAGVAGVDTAAPLAAFGELGILDPTSLPGFHLPGNGIFHLDTNPAHLYLIETDPALNTYNGFLGSGYLINHLNWQPDITQRRLGDSYYELMLIREALLANIGSRFVDASVADERQQFEYLMQNAIAASESLQLSPGISLSRSQIDALQADIVWMEERVIANQKVLVPVVYLAQGSSRLLSDGAVIGGGSISIEGDSLTNAGLVRAHNSISVNAISGISNLGGTIQAVGDLTLQSGGDILNESGHISGENVLLQAEGDIINRTWALRDEVGSGSDSAWSTRVGDTASVTATGNLLQIAGGDIRLDAAALSANNIALVAGNNITLSTVQIDQGYRFNGGDWQAAEEYVRHLQTQVEATQSLSMSAGADITAIAASLQAGGNVALEAGRNISLLAAEESDHVESHRQSDGSFGRDKSSDLVHDASRTVGSTINTGGNLSLTAQKGDITFYAATAHADGLADVQAGGNITLMAGVNTTSHSEQSNSSNAATFKKHNEGYIEQTAVGSRISSGGDLTLNAGADVNLVASALSSDATLRIGSTEIASGHLSASEARSPEEGEGAVARPLNLNVSTLELTNETWNETQKGFKGPLKEVVKVVSAVAGYLVSIFTAGQVDMPEVSIGSHDNSRTKDVLQAGTTLSAQDMQIRVQDTAAFIGATVNVVGTLAVSANDIVIDAAAETHSSSHDEGTDTVKGLGLKLNDDEVRIAGAQETKTSVSDTQHLTEWRGTTINAGQLILNAENNIDILGSQLAVVGDAIVEAGGDLTIAGREGEVKQAHKETIETITVAAAVRNAYVDAVLAVKAIEEAKQALKKAKDALDDAERKAGLGQLEASDVDYYKVNMAAAAANLAQATVSAALSIALAASTTGTGGFYASGSADRDKTVTTSTSTQSLWQGSTLNVGGSALLAASDTLTVQGSDVGVTDTLYLDANNIELKAGQERTTEKTNTTEEHESVSVSANSVGVNASYRDTDADSSSLHHVNTHLSAGTISSRSEALRVAGAQLAASDIDIETDKLIVASLQDESQSKSKMRGVSAGVGIGSGGKVSSVSAGMEKSDSSASSLWVSEQTQIIGSNSLKIRAKDTTLTGAVIANAAYDDSGQLIDQGHLDFQTDTLVVNDLHDINKSKTTGFSVSTSINTDGYKASADQPKTGQTTIGGQYYGHETQQITHATLGGGTIVVGGKTLDENNADELGLATLNRDLEKAQEITVDKDIGGLNASVTVDHRLLTEDGLKDIAKNVKTTVKLGEDIYTAAKSIATNNNLGVTNIGNLIHNNTQATKLAEALLENPKNAWIVEGLKDQNGENYPDALKAASQIAQSLFGVKPTDVAFYDATQTTSSSLEDNAGRDVFGATVTDKNNNEYGNIFIDTSGQATKESLTATAGHEAFETRVLQSGHSGLFFNDDYSTKEALAEDFGQRLTARLNEATGNGLASSTNDWRFGMQQSQAVTAGTWRADAVGNASVEHRQLSTPEIQFALDANRTALFAKKYGLTSNQAKEELLRSAAGSMDKGWDQALSAKDGDTVRARAFLAEEVKRTGQTNLFQVTAAEYNDPTINLKPLFDAYSEGDLNAKAFIGAAAAPNAFQPGWQQRYREGQQLGYQQAGNEARIVGDANSILSGLTHLPNYLIDSVMSDEVGPLDSQRMAFYSQRLLVLQGQEKQAGFISEYDWATSQRLMWVGLPMAEVGGIVLGKGLQVARQGLAEIRATPKPAAPLPDHMLADADFSNPAVTGRPDPPMVPNGAALATDVSQVGKYARRTDIGYRPASEVNATFPDGWSPPYKPGTRVTEFTNSADDIYVRVHGENNMARSWMMKPEAIEGLSPAQIQTKYALPELPIFMSDVHVPAGARIRTGTVNPVFDGIGNATQYELLQRLPVSAFKNTVRLGQ